MSNQTQQPPQQPQPWGQPPGGWPTQPQQPPPPPPRKRHTARNIILIVVAATVVGSVVNALVSGSTPAPTPAVVTPEPSGTVAATEPPATTPATTATPATQPPVARTWHTVVTASGATDHRTALFTLHGTQTKLFYTVRDTSGMGASLVAVYVMAEGTSLAKDGGLPEVTPPPGSGSTELQQDAGRFYLDVTSANARWTVTIKELR